MSTDSGERWQADRGEEGGSSGWDRNPGIQTIPPPPSHCPGLYPPGLPVTLKNAGGLSLVGGNPLNSRVPGHILVPGPSIFGPPRPGFAKKGTAARHFYPSGTHCSIKGHVRNWVLPELWSPGPESWAGEGGVLFL